MILIKWLKRPKGALRLLGMIIIIPHTLKSLCFDIIHCIISFVNENNDVSFPSVSQAQGTAHIKRTCGVSGEVEGSGH